MKYLYLLLFRKCTYFLLKLRKEAMSALMFEVTSVWKGHKDDAEKLAYNVNPLAPINFTHRDNVIQRNQHHVECYGYNNVNDIVFSPHGNEGGKCSGSCYQGKTTGTNVKNRRHRIVVFENSTRILIEIMRITNARQRQTTIHHLNNFSIHYTKRKRSKMKMNKEPLWWVQ